MKQTELKQVLKPLIKQCIREVMFEEGVLSSIVTEVAQGLSTANRIVETNSPSQGSKPEPAKSLKNEESQKKLNEHRKRLLDAINKDAYNGVNIFEDTKPLTSSGKPSEAPQATPLTGVEPDDPGIDISNIPGAGNWSSFL